ncbi:MAG: glycosyltransferase family 4 protein [Colwellia sp.]
MRILHVVSSLNVGGAERFVIDLATEQKENLNCEITILSMGQQGEPLESEVNKLGIKLLHAIKISTIRRLLNATDVAHVHSSYCLLRILLAALFKPVKVVYTRHNERVHQSLKWRAIYLLAKFTIHKMFFVAEKARVNYLKKYPSFKTKSQTILNGVLPMVLTKKKSNCFRISHVGRFVPLKAQHYLIEAIALLPKNIQSKVSLAFFGTGELMKNIISLAQKLIPDVKVDFKGFVTNRDEIYQYTDILIVTSETEGLSLAILEALASGTPTIASNVGGNPELVQHNYNGLLYDYADTKKLAQNINELFEDIELYQKFSKRSLKLFKKGFSMQQCAQNYYSAYE